MVDYRHRKLTEVNVNRDLEKNLDAIILVGRHFKIIKFARLIKQSPGHDSACELIAPKFNFLTVVKFDF